MSRPPRQDAFTDGYVINGTYLSDIRLLFSAVGKEDMLIMIKRGFIGLQDHLCREIEKPVSWKEYIKNYGENCRWKDIQCPLHESQSGVCEDVKKRSASGCEPCAILANYLTAKLILRRV